MKKRKLHRSNLATAQMRILPQCPFWRELGGNRIGCEGITDHCNICLQFDSPESCGQQQAVFCCEHYRKCEIYRAIVEAKYAEEAL